MSIVPATASTEWSSQEEDEEEDLTKSWPKVSHTAQYVLDETFDEAGQARTPNNCEKWRRNEVRRCRMSELAAKVREVEIDPQRLRQELAEFRGDMDVAAGNSRR